MRCESVPEPSLATPDGALLRVTAASICGSDLHLYHARMPAPPGLIVGHEFVGVVDPVGPAVTAVRPGQRVIAPGVFGCGRCRACMTGRVAACTGFPFVRVYGVGPDMRGGQAERVFVPHADFNLVSIPGGLGDEDVLFLTEILPTGYQGVLKGEVAPGEIVAIVGGGPVGLSALLAARIMGAARVLVSDPDAGRRAAVARFGGEPVTPDTGADVVIEAVGHEATLAAALGLVRVGGRVSAIGVFVEPALPFAAGLAFMKDVTLRFGIADVHRHLPPLLALVQAGRLRPRELITHRLPLRDGAEAYRLFEQRRDSWNQDGVSAAKVLSA